jgi:hypothetical protein
MLPILHEFAVKTLFQINKSTVNPLVYCTASVVNKLAMYNLLYSIADELEHIC